MSIAQAAPRSRAKGRRGFRLALPMVGLVMVGIGIVAIAVYLMWPRWPGPSVSPDAPSLPVTVGGVGFNVVPGAIRMPLQRKPGQHDRLDLVLLWPSLTPPDPIADTPRANSEAPVESMRAPDRIFITIANADTALGPEARRNTIYPRYLGDRSAGPPGMTVTSFRTGSPYQGEDLVVADAAPGRFALRCTRPGRGEVPGTCLHERRIAGADVTVRFPRHWLETGWVHIADGIDRAVISLHPTPPK